MLNSVKDLDAEKVKVDYSVALPPQPDIQLEPGAIEAALKAKPDLGSILTDARNAGQNERSSGAYNARKELFKIRESLGERVKQARERATRAWDGVREFGGRWKNATAEFAKVSAEKVVSGAVATREGVLTGVDVGIGLARNQDVRSALGIYMKDQLDSSIDALQTKYTELREAASDKKDQAFLRLQEGVRGLWNRAQEKLVQPQVNRAKELSREVRSIWGAGTAAGERVVGFFQSQAETTSREIRSRGHEVLGWWHEALAKPNELQHQVAAGLAEKISAFSADRLEKTQSHRAKAVDLRLQGQFVRAGTIGGSEISAPK